MMDRTAFNKLHNEFRTFNGTGNLNRANDKIAEMLVMIADAIAPETKAAAPVGGIPEDLKTDPELLEKLRTSVAAPVEPEAEKVVTVTTNQSSIDAAAANGIDLVAEVTAAVQQALVDEDTTDVSVAVVVEPDTDTEAKAARKSSPRKPK